MGAKPEFDSVTLVGDDQFEVKGTSSAESDKTICTFWHIDQDGEVTGDVVMLPASGPPSPDPKNKPVQWNVRAPGAGSRFKPGELATVVGIEVRVDRTEKCPQLECYVWMRNLPLQSRSA